MLLLALVLAASEPLPLAGYQTVPDRTLTESYGSAQFVLEEGKDGVEVRGQHWSTWLVPPGSSDDAVWDGNAAFPKLEGAFKGAGWKEVYKSGLAATFRRGENEFAAIDLTESQLVSNRLEYVKKGPPPITLKLTQPAQKAESLKDDADFPWLTPLPGSKLTGTTHDDGPMRLTFKGEDHIVASGSTRKEYSEPKGMTNLLFLVAYEDALKNAGWEILDDALGGDVAITAHYNKGARDIWLYLHQTWEGWTAIAGDAGASALQQAIASECRANIYGLNFDFNKATLRPDSEGVLRQILQLFSGDPSFKAELSGHTDDVGGRDYNLKLSRERAATVKAWLVKNGVSTARITTQGYADTQPLVPNDSDENRARNRRVQISKLGCTPKPGSRPAKH